MSTSPPPGASGVDERQRQRVTRACEPCRRKKIRCDGHKPCSACAEAHTADGCAYVDAKDRSAYSRRYVVGLEARLQTIEQTLAAAAAVQSTTATTATTATTSSSSALDPAQVRPYFDNILVKAERDGDGDGEGEEYSESSLPSSPAAAESPPVSAAAAPTSAQTPAPAPAPAPVPEPAPASDSATGPASVSRAQLVARSASEAPSDASGPRPIGVSGGRPAFPAQGARMRYDRTGRTIRYIGPSASASLLYDAHAALSEDELDSDSESSPAPHAVGLAPGASSRAVAPHDVTEQGRRSSSIEGRMGYAPPKGVKSATPTRGSRGSLAMQAHRWGLRDRESSPIRSKVSPLQVLMEDPTLPPRTVTDSLVKFFFHYVHSLFPILDHDRFMAWYRRLWQEDGCANGCADQPSQAQCDTYAHTPDPDDAGARTAEADVDPLFPSLLFAVLACASRIAPSEAVCPPSRTPQESQKGSAPASTPPLSLAGMHFYARAHFFLVERRLGVQQTRLSMGPLEGGDAGLDMLVGAGLGVSAVQTLGLLSYFQASSNCVSRAWDLIGQALRNATDLGLHRQLDPASEFAAAPEDAELRRRVWWCVYLLDRMLCVSLGRPLGIEDVSIDASLPSIPFHTDHPRALLTGFRAFVRLIRLQGVIATNAFLRTRAARALGAAQAAYAAAPKNSPARRVAKEALAIARSRSTKLDHRARTLLPQLQRWFEKAPTELKTGVHQPGSVLGLYSCVAFVLYRTTLMLLHRSFIPGGLVSAWKDEVPDGTAASALEQVGASCNVLISAAGSITASLPASPFLLEYAQQLLVAGGFSTLRAWHLRGNPSMAAQMLSLAHGAAAALKRLDASHAAPAARPLRHVLAHVIQQLAIKLGRLSQSAKPRPGPGTNGQGEQSGTTSAEAAAPPAVASSKRKGCESPLKGEEPPTKRTRPRTSTLGTQIQFQSNKLSVSEQHSAPASAPRAVGASAASDGQMVFPAATAVSWPGVDWAPSGASHNMYDPTASSSEDMGSTDLDQVLDETFAALLMGGHWGTGPGPISSSHPDAAAGRRAWASIEELPGTPNMSYSHPAEAAVLPYPRPSPLSARDSAKIQHSSAQGTSPQGANTVVSPVSSLNALAPSDSALSPSTLAMLDYDGFPWLFGDPAVPDTSDTPASVGISSLTPAAHPPSAPTSVPSVTRIVSPLFPTDGQPAHAHTGFGLWGLWE